MCGCSTRSIDLPKFLKPAAAYNEFFAKANLNLNAITLKHCALEAANGGKTPSQDDAKDLKVMTILPPSVPAWLECVDEYYSVDSNITASAYRDYPLFISSVMDKVDGGMVQKFMEVNPSGSIEFRPTLSKKFTQKESDKFEHHYEFEHNPKNESGKQDVLVVKVNAKKMHFGSAREGPGSSSETPKFLEMNAKKVEEAISKAYEEMVEMEKKKKSAE